MEEKKFETEINELLREIGEGIPSGHSKLKKLAQKTQNPRLKLECSISSLQESLDYLRLCIKYQIFDLEATYRENEYLRRLVRGLQK